MTVFLGGEYGGPPWGAYHQTQNGLAQKSQVPAKEPPTQRHGANRGFIEPLSESASRFPVG